MLSIEVSSLKKHYGALKAVDDISFTVNQGDVFGLLGPNGAGKTTTIKILTTLLHPTSGDILVNEFDPVKQQQNVRSSFGIVFQDPSLDSDLTALENMQYHAVLYKIPKEIREKRIGELLRFVELWERKNDMVKTFSGGMKRRLEVARGLLHHHERQMACRPELRCRPLDARLRPQPIRCRWPDHPRPA